MPPPRAVDSLPADVRRWLERALTDGSFTGYQKLEELLREKGYEISKSAIHRYGQALERRLAAIRASTEAAKILADSSPDDQDDRSGAMIGILQAELFNGLVNLQEATDEEDKVARFKMLSAAAKNIATLARASVDLKRHQGAPEAARWEIAADMLRELGEWVRGHHPDQADAVVALLEPFGQHLAKKFG